MVHVYEIAIQRLLLLLFCFVIIIEMVCNIQLDTVGLLNLL